jgi:hypoxanthine phosphoribosyltransferase
LDHLLQVRRDARLVRTEAEVRAGLAAMAQAITAKFADRNPLIVAVMQGGAFTAVHLCAHFDFPYEFDYVHVTRYGNAIEGGELKWHMRPQRELAGRTVLLVDDVLDHGITLRELSKAFNAERPREVAIAVLVDKQLELPVSRPEADFVGFECDDVYLFGCGMDYKGYWRGLPALYALESS